MSDPQSDPLKNLQDPLKNLQDPLKNLQDTFTDILKDIMSMSADVIKKSDLHLSAVTSLDANSVDRVSNNIRTLFERVNTNISSFRNNFDTAIDNYKNSTKTENLEVVVESEKKISAALRKDGDFEKTDIDLTNSDPEDEDVETPPETNLKANCVTKEEVVSPVKDSAKDDKSEGSVSDTDSEKTVRYFDVPVTNEPIEDGDDLSQALDELDKIVDKELEEPKTAIRNTESMSFDFDDVNSEKDDFLAEMNKLDLDEKSEKDDFLAEMNKLELDEKSEKDDFLAEMNKLEMDEKSEETSEQIQKDNHELLDLLNKAMGENEDFTTEDEGDEALRLLEDEISLPSVNPDDSMSSENEDSADEWKPPEKLWRPEDSESEGNLSDVESLADDKEPELKSFHIGVERLDQLDDAEIERLCNMHNINKRKCLKQLKKLKKTKRKRIRLISSSSSSSLSSDLSTSGSVTPDLEVNRPPTPQDIHLPDITALADELAEKLDREDENIEISSDTSSDVEVEEPQKKKQKIEEEKKEEVKKEADDIQIIKSDNEEEEEEKNRMKKRGSWRDAFQLFSSSEDDEEKSDVVVLNVPVKVDDDEEKEEKKSKIGDDEAQIISDDDSDNDDDVTIVDDSFDSGGRGRRNIRALLSDDDLSELTQRAKNEEDERIMRLEEHSKTIESLQSQREDFVLDVNVKTGASLIVVDYNLSKILKPHQKEGVQFMWEACYESVETLKTKPGTGCILAHCMGLGKTLQVITLIHTLFNHPVTKTKHVLIICPLSTVVNWKNEFRKTFRSLDGPSNVQQFFILKGDVSQKIQTIHFWRGQGGVLVMGYESFQILTNDQLTGRVTEVERTKAFEALLNPGPDLVVCDEGHQLKNGRTKKTIAVMKIRTKRRIVLTGTPLQNNLQEYYFMVQFVKPHLLGTHKEYNNRFATPITNGQYHDSRPEDTKLMKKRTHVLTKLLKKTIHRVEAGILASYLPEMKDYTVFVKLTPVQMVLYTSYINMVTSQASRIDDRMFFYDVMILNFNNFHPYTLQLYFNKAKQKKKRKATDETTINDNELEAVDEVTHVRDDWYKASFPDDVATNVNYSSKLKLILDMLEQSSQNGEKTLLFAQYLVEIDVMEHFLKVSKNWAAGEDYFRMDGDTPVENRDQLCKLFNTSPNVKLFLLTHRVGGLGLNLTGANRVIMIGSNHNPTLDTQSMYRVYRFGQQKSCYVYRLLSLATMEEKIYHRCVVKLHLSGTVVDKLHFARHFRSSDLQEMYTVDFSEYGKERPIPVVPTDKLLALMLQNYIDVYKYHLHNSLLENRPEEELTDEDKKLAWDEFNSMEEAAKHVAVAPPVNPLVYLPIFPANLMHANNRFGRYNATRSNPPTMVPNPMNNNTRGFIPRSLLTNGTRPVTPQNVNRFNAPNQGHNPFLNLIDPSAPQTSGYKGNVANIAAPSREFLQRQLQSRLQRLIPATHRLQTYAQAVRQLSRDAPAEAPSGEFNYALNKVV